MTSKFWNWHQIMELVSAEKVQTLLLKQKLKNIMNLEMMTKITTKPFLQKTECFWEKVVKIRKLCESNPNLKMLYRCKLDYSFPQGSLQSPSAGNKQISMQMLYAKGCTKWQMSLCWKRMDYNFCQNHFHHYFKKSLIPYWNLSLC